MVELDDLIQRANEMKPLPATAVRLAGMAQSPTLDLSEVAEVVAFDQALTLKLLRAANSAALGGAERLTRAIDAVGRLGVARVLSLAVAGGVRDSLQPDLAAYDLGEGELWKHSVAAAAAAEMIVEVAPVELPPETFTAALLHDVGKLVMGRHLSAEDLEWIHRCQMDGGRTRLAAEREILGVHHGELGGIIAQHWEMPERVVKGIIYHHEPGDGLDVVCDAVSLANQVAKALRGAALPPPDPDSLERLGLAPDRLPQLVTDTHARFQAIQARYEA